MIDVRYNTKPRIYGELLKQLDTSFVGAISESRPKPLVVGNPNQEINATNAIKVFGGYECLLTFPGVPSYRTSDINLKTTPHRLQQRFDSLQDVGLRQTQVSIPASVSA